MGEEGAMAQNTAQKNFQYSFLPPPSRHHTMEALPVQSLKAFLVPFEKLQMQLMLLLMFSSPHHLPPVSPSLARKLWQTKWGGQGHVELPFK